jgi:Domain of Unknown Function (DUF1080)
MRVRLASAAGVLLLTSLACGLPSAAPPTATPPATSTPNAVETPAPDDAWGEAPSPPPVAGLIDALRAQVEAGSMTSEQAIVSGLQILTGDLDADSTLGEAPASLEGTGVALDAQRYLETGTDESVKAEMERLLTVLAPSGEVLLPYSVPESASLRPSGGLASPATQEDCAGLFNDGFPEGSSAQCFIYKEEAFGSSRIQVFYPSSNPPPGFTSDYAQAALQAVLDSLTAFSNLHLPGRAVVMKDIEVVFSLLDTASGSTLALVPTDPGETPCQVILFPLAITHNEEDRFRIEATPGGPPPATAIFQQTVAHEVFHCFQVWNFPELARNATWGVQDWWGESTATYFSNLVYPAVNDEWMWIDAWAYNSASTPLVYMSYDNFGFFQYLANRIGPDGVLELIDSLTPAAEGDETDHQALLAAYPDIDSLFADYAVAFMDGTIVDASQETIPTAPAPILPMFRVDAAADAIVPFGGQPFSVTRYGVTFGSAGGYDLTPMLGLDGLAALRPINAAGEWTDVPARVEGSCSPSRYYLVLANAAADPIGSGFGLTVTADDPLDCGFTPTPPPVETLTAGEEPPACPPAFLTFGFLEAGTSYGYECEAEGFRAWIDNDQAPYDFITAPQGQDYADVRIEVDVLINATEVDPFGGAVLVCRGAQVFGYYYAFVLAPDGSAQVSDYLDGDEQISRFGSASPGTFKVDDWNQVRVDCIGTHMALYLNGELVVERDMDSLTRGDIGLGAGGASDGFTEVRYRDLVVTLP